MEKRHTTSTLVIACLATALFTAAAVLAGVYLAVGGSAGFRMLQKVNAVRGVVSGHYVGDTDWTAAADGASRGIISALDDRWSYYMTAEEYSDYQDRSNNMASGIGVTITPDEESGGFRILSVAEGSPAKEAGVKAGQVILAVAGEDMRGKSTEELRSAVQAQEGEFSLLLRNPDGSEETLSVHRATFYSNPVAFEMLVDGVGYVAIRNFESGSAENAIRAVDELQEQGARALIFDVRANPGGHLSELLTLLDALLPEGDLFVDISKSGEEYVYTSDEASVSLPMAVLLDENSYSAAEFFAAALEEYGAAVTVGQPSTGKGRSQMTFVLSDGSAVHISTKRYLTPHRVDLAEQGGLRPTIEVPMGTQGDTQLEAAIEYLS